MFTNDDTIATSFMDNLSLPLREAAMEVFHFSNLKEMLEMRLDGPSELLVQRHSLTEEQWNELLDAVILTKLSYFKLRFGCPNLYIDRLLEISGFCLGFPHYDAPTLAKIVAAEHPIFSDWLNHLQTVKKQNQLYAKHNR